MQSQFSCILFALLVPLAACGGGDKKSTPLDDRIVESPKSESIAGFGDTAKPAIAENKSELPAALTFIPTKASECISLGREAAAKGEHVRARELFTAAVKLDKKSVDAQVELSRSYLSTNDKALAIKHANKAVKLAPESSQAYNTLGRAELLRHDYDAAVIAFRQATELNADNVWAWNNLGLVYLTLKDYKEAVNALAEATSRKGTESYMWNNLGLAYEQLDELDDARLAFENGAKLGSAAAKASRKRLEGVDTIVVVKDEKPATKDESKDSTYELREEMPDVPEDIEGGDGEIIDEVTFDDTEHGDEPAVDPEPEPEPEPEPDVVEEPKDEAKPEAPSVPPTTL